MEELKDVYSLEFNSSQFQSEVQSAISRIEELNTAMEEGADVAGELEEAQGNLVSILGMEAKGIENLNAKRNVLVSTSKQLNAESKTGVVVGKQLDTTNKQIAVSTGNAAKAQRGFGASLLAGTRQISQMRRVASTLTFVFRAISAAIPFGLILSFAGPVISFFTSLFKSVDKNAEVMKKLEDNTLGYSERIDIISGELERLEEVEKKRGYLTDNEKKQRDELTEKYRQSADEIVKIEQQRLQDVEKLQDNASRIRVRLLGDTVAGVEANYKLETKILGRELKRQFDETTRLVKEGKINQQVLADQQAALLEEYGLQEQELERQKQKALADIYKKAADKRKQDEETEKNNRLKAIQDEIKLTEDVLKLRILLTEEGSQERLKAELNLINVLESLNKTYAAELGISEVAILTMITENIKKKKVLNKDYSDSVINSIKDRANKNIKTLQDERKAEQESINSTLNLRVTAKETELNQSLLLLEQQRNEELLAAFGNAELQAEIDKEYNDKRAQFEKMANQEIIQIRIDFLKKLRDVSGGDPAALASINKQISELELKFAELGRVAGENIQETNSKFKELADEAGQAVQLASDTVFNVLNAQVQSYIGNLDRAVDKSRSALDEIRSNSENFNARQLEIEKERLERLEAERERAVQRERTLGQIQVGINAAIAISKAAAEGGGFASAFTIAATLASLIAGLAQARVAAGNAFFDGVEYLNRGNNPRGRDTIPAMLNEGERVITTDTNAKYWDVLSAVHNNRIPADVLNGFASAYQQGGLRAALGAFGDNISLSGELGQKAVFVNVAHNNSGLENRLERIESVLMELPKYMPKTTVSANAKGIFRIVEQRQQRKDYSRNWAK
jgi:hypothetical protein